MGTEIDTTGTTQAIIRIKNKTIIIITMRVTVIIRRRITMILIIVTIVQ